MKPTGDVECPPYIDCTHEIEEVMDNKGGLQAVDNEDIANSNVNVNDTITIASSDENKPPPYLQKNILIKKEPGSVYPVAC